MKELKVTRTIEEVTGYEANDGTYFRTKAECEKYEASAQAAITEMFAGICVKPWPDTTDCYIGECYLFDGFGDGSEEYYYVIADIKSETEVKIANMYSESTCGKDGDRVTTDHIGKRILICVGNDFFERFDIRGTEEELVEQFKKRMAAYFRPEEKLYI